MLYESLTVCSGFNFFGLSVTRDDRGTHGGSSTEAVVMDPPCAAASLGITEDALEGGYWMSSTNRPVPKTELLSRLRGAGFGQRAFRLRICCGLFGGLMVVLGLFCMIWSLVVLK